MTVVQSAYQISPTKDYVMASIIATPPVHQVPRRARKHLIRPATRAILLGMCVAALTPAGLALAQTDRIEAITLSSGGLAEIRRNIAVDGTDELTFDVPLEQVNDILKSLLVYDPAGGVSSMTLDGLAPVEETFRNLPFTPSEMGDLAQLLSSLQGVSVRVTAGGREVEGIVLGVDTPTQPSEPEHHRDSVVSLMTSAGQIEVLSLGPNTVVEILDQAMLEKLRTAATVSAQGRVEDMRTISLGLDDMSQRDVALEYVVAAPIWKTAYRLVLGADGRVQLQAWAVIENATGEDWSDIELTLSSGTPVTLTQRLHERYWSQRPDVPVSAQTITPVRPDTYGEMPIALADMAQAEVSRSVPMAAPIPTSVAGPSGASAPAVSAQTDTAATYRLPVSISLPAGQTLSVPYIDTHLTADRISIFQPERGEIHPIAALRIENTTGASLPPGIATFYAPDGEGYAGDAILDGVPDGEGRILSFAADRDLQVTTENGTEQKSYRATLADGVLRVTASSRITTTYSISAAQGAARTVVIEQPRRNGWTFASDNLTSTTPSHYRLEAALEGGETVEVTARFERSEFQSVALVDTDIATLANWSEVLDDPETAEALQALIELQRVVSRSETEITEIEHEIEIAIDAQERVRANLGAVEPGSTLSQRYLGMLEEQEDEIASLQDQAQQARAALTEAQQDLSGFIAAL